MYQNNQFNPYQNQNQFGVNPNNMMYPNNMQNMGLNTQNPSFGNNQFNQFNPYNQQQQNPYQNQIQQGGFSYPGNQDLQFQNPNLNQIDRPIQNQEPVRQRLTLKLENNERGYYSSLYSQLDPSESNRLDGKTLVAPFFKRSGLSKEVLKNVWTIATTNPSYLNKEEFYICLRLISYAQNNIEVSAESIINNRKAPLPKFESEKKVEQRQSVSEISDKMSGLNLNQQNLNQLNPNQNLMGGMGGISGYGGMGMGGGMNPNFNQYQGQNFNMQGMNMMNGGNLNGYGQPNDLSGMEQQQPTEQVYEQPDFIPEDQVLDIQPNTLMAYEGIFDSFDREKKGLISQDEIKTTFKQSGLDSRTLLEIWTLCDSGSQNCLDKSEFILALHWIAMAKRRIKVPKQMPRKLDRFLKDYRKKMPTKDFFIAKIKEAEEKKKALEEQRRMEKEMMEQQMKMKQAQSDPFSMEDKILESFGPKKNASPQNQFNIGGNNMQGNMPNNMQGNMQMNPSNNLGFGNQDLLGGGGSNLLDGGIQFGGNGNFGINNSMQGGGIQPNNSNLNFGNDFNFGGPTNPGNDKKPSQSSFGLISDSGFGDFNQNTNASLGGSFNDFSNVNFNKQGPSSNTNQGGFTDLLDSNPVSKPNESKIGSAGGWDNLNFNQDFQMSNPGPQISMSNPQQVNNDPWGQLSNLSATNGISQNLGNPKSNGGSLLDTDIGFGKSAEVKPVQNSFSDFTETNKTNVVQSKDDVSRFEKILEEYSKIIESTNRECTKLDMQISKLDDKKNSMLAQITQIQKNVMSALGNQAELQQEIQSKIKRLSSNSSNSLGVVSSQNIESFGTYSGYGNDAGFSGVNQNFGNKGDFGGSDWGLGNNGNKGSSGFAF